MLLPGIGGTALVVEHHSSRPEWEGHTVWPPSAAVQEADDQVAWLDTMCLGDRCADPEGIVVRASLQEEHTGRGMKKLIAGLRDLGYNDSSMAVMGYDWRLAPARLEGRDELFTRMVKRIDQLVQRNGTRCVMVAQGSAGELCRYFSHWAVQKMGRVWFQSRLNLLVRFLFLTAVNGTVGGRCALQRH